MQSTDSMEPNDPGATPADAAEALKNDLQTAKEDNLRLLAEMENQRRRWQRDAEQARKYGAERLLNDLLPVVDSLDAALRAEGDPAKLKSGVEMTHRMFVKALEQHGVQVLDPTGEAFNPDQHQAMNTVASADHVPGSVVTVFQKGYRLNERTLRPAMVAVAAEPPPPEDA
jgi:molecular chaperone GrpE